VALVVHQLGEREIKALLTARPRAHGIAEAGGGSLAAVHRDHEGCGAARQVAVVAVRLPAEDPVLHGHGRQFAGPGADDGVAGHGSFAGHRPEHAVVEAQGPVLPARREEEAFPAVGARGVPEKPGLTVAVQAVMPRGLHIGAARRQVGGAVDLAIDHGVVAQPGADGGVALRLQGGDERIEATAIHDQGAGSGRRHHYPPPVRSGASARTLSTEYR